MLEKFMQLSDEKKAQIIKIALIVLAAAAVLIILSVLMRKARRSVKRVSGDFAAIEKNKIDVIRTDMLTRSDVRLWFKENMKNGTYGILETADALKAKDNEIELPPHRGASVYCLSVYHNGKHKDIARRFYVAKEIDPELQSMLADNSGTVVFQK